MARKPRDFYPGAICHVIVRGNNRENIFKHTNDKRKYLELLNKYQQRYAFDVLAYMLMDNHIHLLIDMVQQPLSKAMQGIQQSYTQYFNKKYEHVGHVFQQRYKALLCLDETYLITLLVYIHRNPVRAGLPEGVNTPWSSHSAYIGKHNSLVNVDFILDILDSHRERATEIYLKLIRISEHNSEDLLNLVDSVHDRSHIMVSMKQSEVDQTGYRHSETWDELVERIADESEIEKERLLGPCRIRQIVAARNRLIYEAINQGLCTRSELAARLHIDAARITKGYWQVAQPEEKRK